MASVRRVLFVTHNVPRFPGDAAGSFVLRLAVALQAQGTRVDVIAPGGKGLEQVSSIEGVRIRRVRYGSDEEMSLAYEGTMAEAVKSSWAGRRSLMRLMAATRRAAFATLRDAHAANDPYDILHIHWWFPSGLSLWQPFGRKKFTPPVVITMHGSDVRLASAVSVVHPLMRMVLKRATVRTAVSSWLALESRRIANAGSVIVSPMPVDTGLFALNSPEHTTDERAGVLFVGRLNAQKGLADLLETMAASPLAGIPLVVVGDGPDSEDLRSRADELGLAGRVRWMGSLSQPELAKQYRRALVVVIPSRGEGLGLVAVEAQLSGTAVIAYDDGGLTDVVDPKHGGVLVKPGDLASLARAISDATRDAARTVSRGREARTEMLARFSPEAVASKYREHYLEAISLGTAK